MKNYSTYKVIHNRKNETGKDSYLVQIEIYLPSGKQRFVGTGLKIPSSEWDPKTSQVINSSFATQLNNQISDLIGKIRTHELKLIDDGKLLTDAEIDIALNKKAAGSFVAYMRAQIDERSDIVSGTRYLHNRVANRLEEFGIIKFTDLTYANIVSFNNYISKILKAQPSIAKHHQVIKSYINMATKSELMQYSTSPYLKYEFSKGKHKIRIRLDDDEITRLLAEPLSVTRDCAVFQLFTGISHRDLSELTRNHLRKDKKDTWLEGLRMKSGELYSVFLLPEAVEIIERYKGSDKLIPCADIWDYNRSLKVLAASAKINKQLTTYVLRHTAATWMLRRGVPITTIQKILGHTQLATTMIYAKLEDKTMRDQMVTAFSNPVVKKPRNRKPVQPKRS